MVLWKNVVLLSPSLSHLILAFYLRLYLSTIVIETRIYDENHQTVFKLPFYLSFDEFVTSFSRFSSISWLSPVAVKFSENNKIQIDQKPQRINTLIQIKYECHKETRFRAHSKRVLSCWIYYISLLHLGKTTWERNYVKEELCLHFLCYISLLHFLSTSLMNLLNIQVSGTPNPSAISSNISHASSLTASVYALNVELACATRVITH